MSKLLVSKTLIFEDSEVSHGNVLHVDFKPSGKSSTGKPSAYSKK